MRKSQLFFILIHAIRLWDLTLKQLTGIEKCQCRRQRAQRNHIACAMIVLVCLKRFAVQCTTTAYRLKSELLGNYMREQLKSPTIRFA